MKFYREYNNIYLIPTMRFYYDKELFEGELMFLDLEFTWLIWTVGFTIIKDKYN